METIKMRLGPRMATQCLETGRRCGPGDIAVVAVETLKRYPAIGEPVEVAQAPEPEPEPEAIATTTESPRSRGRARR